MKIRSQIPNLITMGNLLCGCIALFATSINTVAILIIFAAVLDFLDGLVARLLNVHSPMGKQLDSLADSITFGLAPAFLCVRILAISIAPQTTIQQFSPFQLVLCFIPLLLVLAGVWRLARFNIDESQSNYFKGLPIPANGIFWVGVFLVIQQISSNGQWNSAIGPTIITLSVLMSALMVSKIKLLNFKVKSIQWKGNETRYSIVIGSLLIAVLAIILKNPFLSIPLIVLLYIVISIVHYYILHKNEIQS